MLQNKYKTLILNINGYCIYLAMNNNAGHKMGGFPSVLEEEKLPSNQKQYVLNFFEVGDIITEEITAHQYSLQRN